MNKEPEQQTIPFKDIEPGQVFRYAGKIYTKIKRKMRNKKPYNCFSLSHILKEKNMYFCGDSAEVEEVSRKPSEVK